MLLEDLTAPRCDAKDSSPHILDQARIFQMRPAPSNAVIQPRLAAAGDWFFAVLGSQFEMICNMIHDVRKDVLVAIAGKFQKWQHHALKIRNRHTFTWIPLQV